MYSMSRMKAARSMAPVLLLRRDSENDVLHNDVRCMTSVASRCTRYGASIIAFSVVREMIVIIRMYAVLRKFATTVRSMGEYYCLRRVSENIYCKQNVRRLA